MPIRLLKHVPTIRDAARRGMTKPRDWLLNPASVRAGNTITLLKNGGEFFPALESAIDGAAHDIRIETYIFRDDASGQRIATALKKAALRGVRVRVVVDGFGLRATHQIFFEALREAGVELAIFRPDNHLFSLKKSRLRRVHRKIALIDGQIGFVGGINLIDDLNESLSDTEPRYDYAVKIEGPLLADIYPAVNRLWRILLWSSSSSFLRRQHEPLYSPTEIDSIENGVDAMFVVRDNFRFRRSIEHEYMRAIMGAKKSILIVSPYFLPARVLRRELRDAAKRGVAVTLLLQGRADHAILQLATRALYEPLLAAGVTIYEYEIAMLHGKVAVIDDAWATVGSSNLDPFSLFLNREANVIVLHAAFANQLRESVNAEIKRGAKQLQPSDWQRRSRWIRVKSWFAYGFARIVAGWIGFRGDWHQ